MGRYERAPGPTTRSGARKARNSLPNSLLFSTMVQQAQVAMLLPEVLWESGLEPAGDREPKGTKLKTGRGDA